MGSWKYITLIVLLLVGCTLFFRQWSLHQFDVAFKTFDVSYNELASSIAATNTIIVSNATSTQSAETPDMTLTFPQKGNVLYVGCNYTVTWNATSSITALEIALVDAGTRKPSGPKTSGLSSTSSPAQIESLHWKVGNVWPGNYFIAISSINGNTVDKKSDVFTIETPDNQQVCSQIVEE